MSTFDFEKEVVSAVLVSDGADEISLQSQTSPVVVGNGMPPVLLVNRI